ncbi:MAG: L,D-transpeptidase family protein [Gammaproteobacteria bacterium]
MFLASSMTIVAASEQVLAPTAGSRILQPGPGPLSRLLEVADSAIADARLDWPALRAFYSRTAFNPVWTDGKRVLARARDATEILAESDRHGLYPDEYHVRDIESRLQADAQTELHSLELLLTDGLLKYISHISGGRLDSAADPTWLIRKTPVDAGTVLAAALASGSLATRLEALSSRRQEYTRLGQLLAAYRSLASTGGWPLVPYGPRLEAGMQDHRISILRQRLMLSGDLSDYDYDNTFLFDPVLTSAVEEFQARHGLLVDGVVGKLTLAALNVPIETRIQQIMLNMERWRWLPRDLGARYLLVNMAGFYLQVVEDDRPVMDMRVIIGRPYRSTPAFVADLTHIVLNPYWNVPHKLAVEDLLPKQVADPEYLGKQGFRVYADWSAGAAELDSGEISWSEVNKYNFPYRLRQQPGKLNSLGRIKFMLPNPYAVYLHDTPSRHLFNNPVRMFSSGCIRVEEPIRLASYLLRDKDGWSGAGVQQAIDSEKNQAVTLPRKLPVYLIYLTTWVDDQGKAQFRDDVYGRDALVQLAWQASPAQARSLAE